MAEEPEDPADREDTGDPVGAINGDGFADGEAVTDPRFRRIAVRAGKFLAVGLGVTAALYAWSKLSADEQVPEPYRNDDADDDDDDDEDYDDDDYYGSYCEDCDSPDGDYYMSRYCPECHRVQ